MTTNHRAPDPATAPGVAERLTAALEKATPGPWTRTEQGGGSAVTDAHYKRPGVAGFHYVTAQCSHDDATLIAEAVNALPRLLAVVRAAQEVETPINHREHPHPSWPQSECDECYDIRGPRHQRLRAALAALDTEGEGPERRTKPEPVEWWHQ